VIALALTACGTRLDHKAIVAAAEGTGGSAGAGGFHGAGSDQGASGDNPAAGSAGGASGSAAGGGGGGAGSGGQATGRGTAGQQGQAGRTGAASASGTTITLGVVGTLSGPVGAVYAQTPTALRVWARDLNDRGGINGHPVDLIFADDGGDPARYQSEVRDLVENRHVLAFVGNPAPLTNQAAKSYLEAHRVSVVGGDLGSSVWIESPMHFPQGTTADEQLFGVLATGKRLTGKIKFGTITCQELQVCHDADSHWQSDYARALGMQPVSRAQVTIAQPDYTAECLNARQAGAELLVMAIDINSAYRIATSCARAGYHPPMSVPYSGISSAQASDPNLEGLMGTLPTFPWVATDTPGELAFAAAMQKYAPGSDLSGSASVGWAAGKLFEKAATVAPQPLTREGLLAALWSMKGETLGGLTPPLTFTKDQPTAPNRCWFVMQIVHGQWTTPSGSATSCP